MSKQTGPAPLLRPYWAEAMRHIKRMAIGRKTIQLDGQTFRVAYEARNHGKYDMRDMHLLREASRGHRCVFDIGGNLGLTSLVMATAIGHSGTVYTFEASEAACLIIRENALLNGFTQIVPINAVVAQASGEVIDFHWNHASGRASVQSQLAEETVSLGKCTLAIDDFVRHARVVPGFIKVDVEGAELSVLSGMRETLDRHRMHVYVEVHAWMGRPITTQIDCLLSTLTEVRYRAVDLRTRQTITDSRRFDNIPMPSVVDAQARLLLIPNEAAVPTWLEKLDTALL